MPKKRSPNQLRNLAQYKNMTDEEFKAAMLKLDEDWFQQELVVLADTFEERVKKKMDEFREDYDLSDMKFNDKETLKILCKALITVEDYETILVRLRTASMFNLAKSVPLIKEFSKIISDTRRDISRLQDDLKISRKIRKSTKEESARADLARIKEQASKFYKKKMMYVFCKKCNMLLSTIWFLYPEKENTLSVVCSRRYTDDEGKVIDTCGHVTTIASNRLLEKRGTNHPEGFEF